MTKKLICALLAALLFLTGCARNEPNDEDSYPTLPSFSQEQPPLQQLQSAIAATESAGSFTAEYGTIHRTGEEADEDRHSQSVTADAPFDRQAMYAAAEYLPDNPGFLQALCDLSLRAIPSNTGTIRFQMTDLSWEDANSLLYAHARTQELIDTTCSVSMELDAQGRFHRMEVVFEGSDITLTAFLSITFPETP